MELVHEHMEKRRKQYQCAVTVCLEDFLHSAVECRAAWSRLLSTMHLAPNRVGTLAEVAANASCPALPAGASAVRRHSSRGSGDRRDAWRRMLQHIDQKVLNNSLNRLSHKLPCGRVAPAKTK